MIYVFKKERKRKTKTNVIKSSILSGYSAFLSILKATGSTKVTTISWKYPLFTLFTTPMFILYDFEFTTCSPLFRFILSVYLASFHSMRFQSLPLVYFNFLIATGSCSLTISCNLECFYQSFYLVSLIASCPAVFFRNLSWACS